MQTVKYYHGVTGALWKVRCIQRDPQDYFASGKRTTPRKYPTANEADAKMSSLGYTRKRPKVTPAALPAHATHVGQLGTVRA